MNIGIYNLHMRAQGGGEKLTLALAQHLSLSHKVSLFCAESIDIPMFEQFFDVDLSRVSVTSLNGSGPVMRVIEKLPGVRQPASILHHYVQLKKLNLDLFINNSYGSRLMCPAARGIFMCMFPHAVVNRSSKATIDSYSTIVAISRYSADWVQEMWKRCPEIIYPPCDDMGPPAVKERIILHVGRFTPPSKDERHRKGQELLLEGFKRASDLHRDGWTLHLVGSAGDDKDSKVFVETVVQSAQGLPVLFHLNAAREKLRNLYRRAAIYWHATGYGFDVEQHPLRQEHFGITTVEAMSAGAVPVVYASGGQREIVSDEVDGLWWDDIDELLSQTRRLSNDAELRCRLSRNAVASSKRFGRETFASEVDQVIRRLAPTSE
jgi:glycosyltransferase involved in cell wall biosynthesis